MSSVFFPTLPGTKMEVTRTPEWSTKVHRAASGAEQRVGYYSSPLYEFKLSIEVLREGFGGGVTAEASTLSNFFNARQGSLDTFFFVDPLDGTTRTVRFAEDKLEMERPFSKLWAAKSVKLREVRG